MILNASRKSESVFWDHLLLGLYQKCRRDVQWRWDATRGEQKELCPLRFGLHRV